MSSKVSSIEEKVKLPPTETISRCYQSQGNRKVIRILTVAVYVLAVSLAAIMLSLYYIFIWDPTIRPFVTKANNCDKIVIPEKIAIRLLNSTEVTADQFYKHIINQYRLINQLQQQRQQFLQKQHLQLQQMAAGNRFKEIFATATIIQANANDRPNKPVTPTNGTFLLDARQAEAAAAAGQLDAQNVADIMPILDTPPMHVGGSGGGGGRRKSHRKHYTHHRHNTRRSSHRRAPASGPTAPTVSLEPAATISDSISPNSEQQQFGGSTNIHHRHDVDPNADADANVGGEGVAGRLADADAAAALALNAPIVPAAATLTQRDASSPLVLYTPMPIPLILNSKEAAAAAAADSAESSSVVLSKRPLPASAYTRLGGTERKSNAALLTRKRTAAILSGSGADVGVGVGGGGMLPNGYDTYLNPFLTGELIFEK